MSELITKKPTIKENWNGMTRTEKNEFIFGSIFSLLGIGVVVFHPDLHTQVLGSTAVAIGLYWVNLSRNVKNE